MAFISYAQNFEDVMLWRALSDIEAGHYLDVGAQDPVVDSVSRAFYDAGWRGIHIEPTVNYARALRENRPDELVIKAVVSADLGLRTFYEVPGTGLSTGVADIAEQHRAAGWEVVQRTVPSVPLASLLDQFEGKDIHWLKIDVEGMELDVLSSWGDHPARPWVLVIESTFPNTQEPTHHAWIDQVTQRGYREVYFDGLSRYFLAETQMQREAAFATPPNVFDQFHVERHHFSSGLVRQSEEAMQRRMAEIEQKRSEQEQRHQLELAQLEEVSGQRETLSQEQIAHLQHALHEHELAQDRFRGAIGEKEGELAALRQQLDQLRTSHDQAVERLQSDRARDDQAHRAHVEGLEAALSIARATMDRLGLELDRREAALLAMRDQWEESQAKLQQQIDELNAAFAGRDADLHTAQDALKDAARVHEDHEREHRRALQSLEDQLHSTRQALTEAERRHDLRQAELEASLGARAGELETSRRALEGAQTSAAERENEFHRQLHEKHEELASLHHALEQRQAELARQASRLDCANAYLVELQSDRLRRRTWFRRNAIDKVEFAALTSRVRNFLTHPAHEDIAVRQNTLDRPSDSVTTPAMSMQIANSSPTRATTLDELLGHHDLAFVRCAYRTVLGREPDPEGEAYYLARLRTGFAKLHMIRQLRRSAEGRHFDPGIAGLDRAIRSYWRARIPALGFIVRLFSGQESDGFRDRQFRSLANTVAKLATDQEYIRCDQLRFHSEIIQSIRHCIQSIEQSNSRLVDNGLAVAPGKPFRRSVIDGFDLTGESNGRDIFAFMKINVLESQESEDLQK